MGRASIGLGVVRLIRWATQSPDNRGWRVRQQEDDADHETVVARNLSPKLFENFYRDEYPQTLALVLALRGPRVGAEDVAQEAFLRAYQRWEAVALLERPEHWVRRVALNLATSRWRRLGAEARALVKLGRRDDGRDHAADVDGADWFWEQVRRLPRHQQRVVALRYAADLPVAEIADVLELAQGTVTAALHHARKRLAELTDDEGRLS